MKGVSNEDLIKQYRNEIDEVKKEVILNNFFTKNQKFAYHIAKKYKHHVLEHEDIAGFAVIGMIKAFHKYDPATGFKFITYASRSMINEILMQFRKADYKKSVVSLDEPVSHDTENIALLDVLPDTSTMLLEDMIEQKDLVRVVMEQAETLLTDKEYIVVSNILTPEPKTQRELSIELKVSQSYVSRIEAKGLKKLRDYLESNPKPTRKKKEMIQTPKPTKVVEVPPVTEAELPVEEKTVLDKVKPQVVEVPSIKKTALRVEGKTVLDKVKYAMQHYPNLSIEEIANGIQASVSTVRTYVNQIKHEQSEVKTMKTTITEERKLNLNEDDLKVLSEITKIEEENKRLKNIAKDAIDKMLLVAKEKEEMAKQMEEYKHRIERLDQLNQLLMAELVEARKNNGRQQIA